MCMSFKWLLPFCLRTKIFYNHFFIFYFTLYQVRVVSSTMISPSWVHLMSLLFCSSYTSNCSPSNPTYIVYKIEEKLHEGEGDMSSIYIVKFTWSIIGNLISPCRIVQVKSLFFTALKFYIHYTSKSSFKKRPRILLNNAKNLKLKHFFRIHFANG